MLIQYFRRIFTGFGSLPRPTSIPPISEAQAEALDALQFYSEECGRSFEFRKGDVQYINNLSIFHARDGWTDTKDQYVISFTPICFFTSALLIPSTMISYSRLPHPLTPSPFKQIKPSSLTNPPSPPPLGPGTSSASGCATKNTAGRSLPRCNRATVAPGTACITHPLATR